MSFYVALLFLVLISIVGAQAASKSSKSVAASKDSNDHRGLTPFFLQDPYDQMCLGPEGFTNCDERALWILTKRTGKKTYSLVSFMNPSGNGACLQRKSMFFGLLTSDKLQVGACTKSNAKTWDWEFLDQQLVRLSNRGQCLTRGKKGHKSSISLDICNKGDTLPLLYHPTSVHENGFYLKSADGSCFDGSKFRSCSGAGSGGLLWGVGVKYIWGEAKQYLFSFSKKEKSCVVKKGSKVEKGDCSTSGALVGWGLHDGRLSVQNGKLCAVRKSDDTVNLLACNEGSEYVSIEVPSVYTTEELASMLQDPVSCILQTTFFSKSKADFLIFTVTEYF